MAAATSSLLDLPRQGELRHRFVRATVEQLLCLALAGLARIDERFTLSIQISARDKNTFREVRAMFDRRLHDPPRVETLAKQFGINRNKLSTSRDSRVRVFHDPPVEHLGPHGQPF